MATYAIGDIQGCMGALRRLLDHIKFDQAQDRLWFVGDLVNRGPDSLEVLRFVKKLGTSAVTVLGNHDIHLLALWSQITQPGRKDTLQPILSASDVEELLNWLRFRPLLHAENGFVMIHAGILPSWSITQATALAREVEEALQRDNFQEVLPAIYFRKSVKHSAIDAATCMYQGRGPRVFLQRTADRSSSRLFPLVPNSQPRSPKRGYYFRPLVRIRYCQRKTYRGIRRRMRVGSEIGHYASRRSSILSRSLPQKIKPVFSSSLIFASN
jgi:hypothetical protein